MNMEKGTGIAMLIASLGWGIAFFHTHETGYAIFASTNLVCGMIFLR